ncbi:unnamed protein product [Vitrella brassicaformis CCMP3155]|uniref:Uncharacterized protein n=1 Tax=Vitrella brassicaformis (strain CCMP3155) TaxID=1169540 RepID=A0A0G4G4Z5_VITBC|nr:unnamed protein product [Vitrella brassicaformis CCMP3155]|eukprot:CEM23478.1 unnamed protein product [Vitrella brassicaformis CCMP3155]
MDSLTERTITVRFPDDGEADAPLKVHEGIARPFKYLQQVLEGAFEESQQREVRIKEVTRAVGVVVLQHEIDIVNSLTKDNLLDAMIALEYLQFDTDKIFTPGSTQSLLWRIHRRVSWRREVTASCLPAEGSLLWFRWCMAAGCEMSSWPVASLLDSFARYAFIARFIHRHKDIRVGLLPCLLKAPQLIRAQWRRCERGEAEDDASKAAVSLVGTVDDELSYGRIDMPCHELSTFITEATGSPGLSDAHSAVFEQDIFTSSASYTTHPFDDGKRGSIERGNIFVDVAGLRHGPPFPWDSPADAPRDADAKVGDVRGWNVRIGTLMPDSLGSRAKETFVSCFGADFSLEVPCGAAEGTAATQPAAGDSRRPSSVKLHEPPVINVGTRIEMGEEGASVDVFSFILLGTEQPLGVQEANISAEALKGDARLKEVKMKVTVRFFPMRTLAFHYLRLCARDGHWAGVTLMDGQVDSSLFFSAAIQDVPQSKYDTIGENLTGDAIRESFSVLPAVLPIVPTLPPEVQEAFEDALKEAVDAQQDDHFKQLYNALINSATQEAADRRRLEAENKQLRERIITLEDQGRRGTKRPREEMDGQQQQQREECEGGADQQAKRPREEDTKMTT